MKKVWIGIFVILFVAVGYMGYDIITDMISGHEPSIEVAAVLTDPAEPDKKL